MISVNKCFTGRVWVNILSGVLAIGFGPNSLIERIVLFKKVIYARKVKRDIDKDIQIYEDSF